MHILTWTTCALIVSLAPCAAQAICDPLIGTVTKPDGTAIVGAKVEVFRAGGRGTNLLDLDYKNHFRRVGVTPTDRRGRFAVQLPVGLPCRVVVDHAPYAVWLREDCLPGEDLNIQLQHPATFHGTLTKTDGTPMTGKLRAWMRDSHDEAFRGNTDERGHFRRVGSDQFAVKQARTNFLIGRGRWVAYAGNSATMRRRMRSVSPAPSLAVRQP
ncbi:MAG: hypothetical protein ACI9OJ_004630 [Myxococcota bacterium]|jgi:hypothetical protein